MKQTGCELTREQLEQYDRDGFLILPDYFDSESVARFSDAAEDLKKQVGPIVKGNPRLQIDRVGDEPAIRQVWPVIDISEAFAALARDERVLGPMASLFGGPPVLFEDKLNYKYPKVGSAFPIHQDFAYWKEFSPRLTSVFVYIDEATEENGCMYVIPGWHKKGLLPVRQEAVGANTDLSIPSHAVDPSLAVKATGRPGTVLMFSCFTPHFSGPNLSTRYRRAFILTYNPAADGSFYEAGKSSSGFRRDTARRWIGEQGKVAAGSA